MNISDSFNEQPWAKRLLRRGPNFRLMCEHAAAHPNSVIIETGTAWHEDNWEGQGQSSRVWAWLMQQEPSLSVISIDIRKEASDHARKYCSKVQFRIGDSPKVLASLDRETIENCSVLYLDSFDWSEQLNLMSALHHLVELTSVFALLSEGCMIVVDDRHGDERGKHWLVEKYMDLLGIKPVFKNCQMGWIKTAVK